MQKTTSKKTTTKGTKKPSSSKVSSEKKAEKKTVRKTKGEKLKLEKIPKMPPKVKALLPKSNEIIKSLKKDKENLLDAIKLLNNRLTECNVSESHMKNILKNVKYNLETTEIANSHLRTEIDQLEANIQELQKRGNIWERAAEKSMLENKDIRSKIEEFKNLNWFQRLFWKKD